MLRHGFPRVLALSAAGVVLASACGGTVSTGSGGSTASSSTGSSSTGSSSTGSSSTGSSSTGSSSSSSGGCGSGCGAGLDCCNGACVNHGNDILNCGTCGNTCAGAHPYCANGTCGTPPCAGGPTCAADQFCCGIQCCNAGELCCEINAGDSMIACTQPQNGTCPPGCPACVCASPDTPIATPLGEREIQDLRVGDLVYSVRGDAFVVAPIAQVNRVPVQEHRVVRVTLDSGRVLEISPKHPTADGRTFAELHPGSRLGTARVVSAELVPYTHPFTYDILPATPSGAYVAGGVVIGSTLAEPR